MPGLPPYVSAEDGITEDVQLRLRRCYPAGCRSTVALCQLRDGAEANDQAWRAVLLAPLLDAESRETRWCCGS